MISKQDIHHRLQSSFDFLKSKGVIHTQTEFAEALGMKQPSVAAAFKGIPARLTMTLLNKISDTFPQISRAYLINGIGDIEAIDLKATRPDFPASVAAGFTEVCLQTINPDDIEHRPVVSYFPDYDFTIRVSGDSMLPELHDNDTIACRWLETSDAFAPDKLYVLDTRDGAVVKNVERRGDFLYCTSLNPDYEPFTIEVSTVLRAAVVVGIIRQL